MGRTHSPKLGKYGSNIAKIPGWFPVFETDSIVQCLLKNMGEVCVYLDRSAWYEGNWAGQIWHRNLGFSYFIKEVLVA